MGDTIHIVNAHTNNLKNLDLKVPIGCLTVVSGVSGSGKSSLVFDSLYGEAHRRYLDSLSSYVRQYIESVAKPEVDDIVNLPPAVAVKQNRMRANQRSSVATLTELHDHLQVLFAHLATLFCPSCGDAVTAKTPLGVAQHLIIENCGGANLLVLAPLQRWKGVPDVMMVRYLREQGFIRVYVDQVVQKIETIDAKKLATSSIVVDRVLFDEVHRDRFLEACALAFKAGRGRMCILREDTKHVVGEYSSGLECLRCDRAFSPTNISAFSYNHPLGACQVCQGFGRTQDIDWNLVFPDMDGSIASRMIAPLNFGRHADYYNKIEAAAVKAKIDIIEKPFSQYEPADWAWLRTGGKSRTFQGMDGYFAWLARKKYKAHYRIHAARFQKYNTCTDCAGKRFRKETLYFKLLGKTIADISGMSIDAIAEWVAKLRNVDVASNLVEDSLLEMEQRLSCLQRLGLGYLGLDRVTTTLSGGELQRIHLTRCLGNALTATLYCLDEPTTGLHPQNTRDLMSLVFELRDGGNTVVCVEHDRMVIERADHVVGLGQGAGHLGGQVVYEGEPLAYLGPNLVTINSECLPESQTFFVLRDAAMRNLKNLTVRFPLGRLTVVCGVSGSGKSTLIHEGLLASLKDAGKAVGHISQQPISGNSRSNIATYLGVFDVVRKVLSNEDLAKRQKLLPGAFSFNVPGGRCEVCKGMGSLTEDLAFLGDVAVRCPSCFGHRFKSEVLAVKYRGRNLTEILALTVAEAREFFFDIPAVVAILGPVCDLGLGYLTLGQQTSSFSGGEAQRLKLLGLLGAAAAEPTFLLFDEPSSGLADEDVAALLKHFKALAVRGHSLVLVEHNLDLMRQADWLIELGPGAAERGGYLVYEGPPAGLVNVKESPTAPYLSPSPGGKKMG